MILKIWLNDAMIGCFLVVGAMKFFKIEKRYWMTMKMSLRRHVLLR
jgi:hypothetical protein